MPQWQLFHKSAGADFASAAEQIGPDFVFSAKPNPAHVADAFSKDTIKQEIGHIIKVCRQAGCSFEIVLKDISSVAYQPDHLKAWADIAMDLVHS